jgi:hypothetical protein
VFRCRVFFVTGNLGAAGNTGIDGLLGQHGRVLRAGTLAR